MYQQFKKTQRNLCLGLAYDGCVDFDTLDLLCGEIDFNDNRDRKVKFKRDIVTDVRYIPRVDPRDREHLFYSPNDVFEFKQQARLEKMREMMSILARPKQVRR
jgi:hypothetical protein